MQPKTVATWPETECRPPVPYLMMVWRRFEAGKVAEGEVSPGGLVVDVHGLLATLLALQHTLPRLAGCCLLSSDPHQRSSAQPRLSEGSPL